MNLYFEFPAGWWVLFIIIYGLYFFLFFQRKSYQSKSEIKTQIFFSLIALLLAFIIEFLAINLELWTYFPGNWPIAVWLSYFGTGLLGYQLMKKTEESLLEKTK